MSGGLIAGVEPGSPGARLGLQPGDVLVAINGHVLRDLIDYEFYGAADAVRLDVSRGQQALTVTGQFGGAQLGLTFEEITFDGPIRRCANDCPFCFVKQVPPGLRRTRPSQRARKVKSLISNNHVDHVHRLSQPP